MKKGIKLTAAAALAVSAITPVAAFAAETTLAPGYYSSDEFMSVKDFAAKKTSEKKAFFKENFGKSNFIFVDASGKVYDFLGANGEKILNATDTELPKYSTTLAAYQTSKGVTVSESGIAKTTPDQKGELEVVSVSAINSTQVEIKFNQAIKAKEDQNLLDHLYFSLTADKVVGSELSQFINDDEIVATLSKDGKTIVITADYASDFVIWNDKNTSIDEGYTPLSIDGTNDVVKNKTIYVQARDLVLANGELADTVEDKFVAIDKDAPKIAKISSEVNGTSTDVTVVFDEPVVDTGAQFYFDSNKVTASLDATGRTLEFTVDKILEDGEYEFEAVGVQDLAGNAPTGDVLSKDLVVTTNEEDLTVPKVLGIEQVHDGAFYVIFNTEVAETEVTIKNLQNNTDETYLIGGEAYATIEDEEDGTIVGHKYRVHFANLTENADPDRGIYEFGEVYKTSTQISRSVIVDKIVSAEGVPGKKFTKTETFITDLKAPTVKKSEFKAGQFQITFNDAPFNGGMLLDTSKDIIVKLNVDGETKSATISAAEVDFDPVTGVLTVELNETNHEDFFKDGKMINGDYKFELPRGLVTDDVEDDTPQNSGPYASIASTETIKVTTGTDASVPQTAQKLVKYDPEQKAIYVFFVGKNIDPTTATTAANYSIASNTLTNASKLEFTSSNGKSLQEAFGAENEALQLDLPEAEGALVKIFLEDNTIVRDGQYTLTVKNVATKSGAKMLPTSVPVADLDDNTAPTLQKAVITGDGQLELTFSESVELELVDPDSDSKATNAVRNFVVKVGTEAYNVETVTKKPDSNDRVLVIHTKDVFNANGAVNVELKRDQNNDMFVTDIGGNEAAVKTVRATKLQ